MKLEDGLGAEFLEGIFHSSISHKLRSSKNSLFNENINASVGELSFDIGDCFSTQTGGRVNANMAPSSSNASVVASILASGQSRFESKLSSVS
ncbi:MAG: hypothetical protein HYV01_21230 [Deltaproteobacteria bacterium]|nr:hypothetical protein [Deltaproteobacteria bacterium]